MTDFADHDPASSPPDASDPNESWDQIELSDRQRYIVDWLAGEGPTRLGISPIPWRGFFWKTVRVWQQKYRKPFSSLDHEPPEAREQYAVEIRDMFLARVLKAYPSHRRDELRAVIHELFQGYIDQFNRPEARP